MTDNLTEAKAALVTANAALEQAKRTVTQALDKVSKVENTASKKQTPAAQGILVVNDAPETAVLTSLATARIEDTITIPPEQKEVDFTMDDIVRHKDLMTSLAHPLTSAANLTGIWDNNIRDFLEAEGANNDYPDEALDMAENCSPSGLAITTLDVVNDNKKGGIEIVPVHIVLNTENNQGLIVGDKISPQLTAAFNKVGITYVNRNTKTAKAKIEKALNQLTSGSGSQKITKERLTDAFKYRNDVDYKDNRSLSALLVDGKIEQLFGKYLVKNPTR